jgi:hypothetical protein
MSLCAARGADMLASATHHVLGHELRSARGDAR